MTIAEERALLAAEVIERRERATTVKGLVVLGGWLKSLGAPEEILEHLRAIFRWVQARKVSDA